jgi:hypothetical protein
VRPPDAPPPPPSLPPDPRAGTNQGPRTLAYNPAENALLVTSDVDGGSYELYMIPKDTSRGAPPQRGPHALARPLWLAGQPAGGAGAGSQWSASGAGSRSAQVCWRIASS